VNLSFAQVPKHWHMGIPPAIPVIRSGRPFGKKYVFKTYISKKRAHYNKITKELSR
jgi:hypothetical protein